MACMSALPSSASPSLPSPSPGTPISTTSLSIHQRIRLHCRERLVVHPLEWTDLHLELLQCSFEPPSRAPAPVYLGILEKRLEGKPGISYLKRLIENDTGCDSDLTELLADDESLLFCRRQGIHFYFNHEPINLPCNVFFNPLENVDRGKGLVPAVAYVDLKHLDRLRSRRMAYYLGRRRSVPTRAIFDLHLKKVTPPNRRHDPYLVALLLAVAFQQQRVLKARGIPKSRFLSQVLMTDYKEKFVHLFAAHIPSSFLDMLNLPTSPPSSAQESISIRHIGVPLRPYRTFRLRLLSLLLHPYDNYMQSDEASGNDSTA